LGAFPAAVPCARLHVRQVLWEWALPVDVHAAELLVSELVSNSLQATGAVDEHQAVGLRLSAGNAVVLIEVWDGSTQPPVPAELEDGCPPLDHEGGRGLFLVEMLSARWGWHLTKNPSGKVTWCEIFILAAQPGLP
jgi:anti-sigma regulatory factor (Ser/Thr protein kinase)